ASMTNIKAPQPPKMYSESNVWSKKSIWPGMSQIWNCTNEELDILITPHLPSLMILFVLSRKRVSLGETLWKTTFWIEDFPLL
ncbi:hypothetical protein EGW08_015732, partial [Elysia chlorotica]